VIRLAVRCRAEQAEAVLAELLALVPGGLEEARDGDLVEYALYGAPGELPEIGAIEAAAGGSLVEVVSAPVPGGWADRWRDFHRPVLVGGRVWIRPPWADPPPAGAADVVVDPGQAFGTGAHPTTRMCCELLVALAAEGGGGALHDLGTGSGVLAIAGSRLGFAPVRAYDHEPAALAAAAANAAANGVAIELERVNLRERVPPLAGTVVANLTAPLLGAVASRLAAPPRAFICSGLLAAEAEAVAAALAERGLGERQRLTDGEWAALRLEARA